METFCEMIRLLWPHDFDDDDDDEESHDGRRRRRAGKMPKLQDVNIPDGDCAHAKRVPRNTIEELEPAFLSPTDYPKGWMVYDIDEGVILKARADKLQQERILKARERQEQQSVDERVSIEQSCPLPSSSSAKQQAPSEDNAVKAAEIEPKRQQENVVLPADATRTTEAEDDEATLQTDDEMKPQSPVVTAS